MALKKFDKTNRKGIVGCPLVISIVISYDALANKIEYAGIDILMMICAFYIIALSIKQKDGSQSRHNINKSVGGPLARKLNIWDF